MTERTRAFELDALRGFSIIMMVIHHFMFDVRYLLQTDLFAMQESFVFVNILRPFFVCVFLFVSGICSVFSKSNLKRSARMFIAALVLSIGMGAISILFDMKMYVFFNILHLIALGTFIAWVFERLEIFWINRNNAINQPLVIIEAKINTIIIILAMVIFMAVRIVEYFDRQVSHYFFLPFGILPRSFVTMADYLPVIPWLGIFFLGIVAGRTVYKRKGTAFPGAPSQVKSLTRPIEWVGRHALPVYVLHQPILLAILFSGRYLGLW